ncbi:MAG: ABC transporter ATP-binding protein [Bacillota bacterium]|nr:ABC transporter ATP-binding protein [Bacillota bacterium]
MALLDVKGVSKRFGGLLAVNSVDLAVNAGELVGLIGPNGAGKTTLFNCIAGHFHADEGQITFDGKPITGMPAEDICALGLVRTFQIVKIITRLTVLENVMVGAFLRHKNVALARQQAREVIGLCGLVEVADTPGRSLTIAYKKRLELARALATQPKMILLDEVMAGLTPRESRDAVDLIHRIRDTGITILMVEHVMEIIMPISDRLVVLDSGSKIAEGTAAEVSRDDRVVQAYLGVKP